MKSTLYLHPVFTVMISNIFQTNLIHKFNNNERLINISNIKTEIKHPNFLTLSSSSYRRRRRLFSFKMRKLDRPKEVSLTTM